VVHFPPPPIERMPELWVYFDSRLHYGEAGRVESVILGHAVFGPNPPPGIPPLSSSLLESPIGRPIAAWSEAGSRLWERAPMEVLSVPGVRGPQLYDLIAARGAALALRVNSVSGRVRFIGDGQNVIDFLNGKDDAFSFEVGGSDWAERIRGETLTDAEHLPGGCSWTWVPSDKNRSDPELKRFEEMPWGPE